MFLRNVFPATAVAVLVLTSPAYAAGAAGPSPTPLILEFALAFLVMTALALKGVAARAFAAVRRRLSPGRPSRTVVSRATDA
jgi:hypothetical protein